MKLFAGWQWRCGYGKQTFGRGEGRREWDNLGRERGDTHAAMCEVEKQWKLLCDAASSTWCSVTTERRGMGWEPGGRFKTEGTYVHLWLIHVNVRQKSTQYCKAVILHLK